MVAEVLEFLPSTWPRKQDVGRGRALDGPVGSWLWHGPVDFSPLSEVLWLSHPDLPPGPMAHQQSFQLGC